ncbi:MAG: acyl-CoA thioesterase [Deferribacterales bacterium]
MNTYKHVRPEHLNHNGYLFGGFMLLWIDEVGWMTASLDYPGCKLVTVAMDSIVFKHQVLNGSILRFESVAVKIGRSSVTYKVVVFADEPGGVSEKIVFSTNITFCRINADGKAVALPKSDKLRSQE